MNDEVMITNIGYFLAAWAGIQGAYALTILLLGNVMSEYYDWGIYEKPETLYEKSINVLFASLLGIGPYIYKRISRYNWLARKCLMIVFLFLFMIASIYVYKFIILILTTFFL